MAYVRVLVIRLRMQGLRIRTSRDRDGPSYYIEAKEGTGYSLRAQHLQELNDEKKLTWAGIEELHLSTKTLNTTALERHPNRWEASKAPAPMISAAEEK